MKRIIFVLSLATIVAVATPFAAAQKSGKSDKGNDKSKQDDGQSSPFGPGRSNQPKANNPQPPPRPQPQPQPQPDPRRLRSGGDDSDGKQDSGGKQGPFRDPRGRSTGGSNDGPKGSSGNSGGDRDLGPQGPSKRFNPQPPPDNQPSGKSGNQFGGSGDSNKTSGRTVPRSFGQPADSGNGAKGGGDQGTPRMGRKTDITPPGRGGSLPEGGGNVGGSNVGGGNAGGGKNGKTFGTDEGTPKPRRIRDDGPGNPQPLSSGGGQPEGSQASGAPEHVRRPLGKPSGSGRAFGSSGSEGPGNQGKVEAATVHQPRSLNNPPKNNNLPVTYSKPVDSPSRFEKRSLQIDTIRDNQARKAGGSGKPIPIQHAKPVPFEQSGPQGGRVYRGSDYHHEYSHNHHSSSSWAIGIGVSDGSSSFAFGYANGGGHSAFAASYSSYSPCYHPYWHHPCWYEPVYYTPCYAVVTPVYYSPWYAETVVYDPWAYNSSSFAFGYSSFGGCALSSFSFAYSTSHWGVGFGWTPAPVYTVYTPAYDPYFTSVFVPGYYELVDQQVWVDGRYDEVVRTPVIEPVVDPLGNTYDAVTEAGSVDYVWTEGHWTVERQRIWHEGHFEHVAAF